MDRDELAAEPLQGDSLLLATQPPWVLVLIWLTLEGWKTESTLEQPSGVEPGIRNPAP